MAPVKWMAAEVLAERKYSHYSDVVRNTATHSGTVYGLLGLKPSLRTTLKRGHLPPRTVFALGHLTLWTFFLAIFFNPENPPKNVSSLYVPYETVAYLPSPVVIWCGAMGGDDTGKNPI